MGHEALFVRRTLPLLLVALSIFLLLVGFTMVGPFMVAHPPGPTNPGLGWYMLYESFPVLLFLAVILLLFCARSLWTRGRVDLRAARQRSR
jgi:uncharacterized RDD family membrane protein YckC